MARTHGWTWVLPLLVLMLPGPLRGQDQAADTPQDAPRPRGIAFTPEHPPATDAVLHQGDRVLFLGDQVTQQMFYTRAVAAGLLALRPEDRLRFFNGGRNDAVTAESGEWVDELIAMVRPQVVFLCFGYHDVLRGKADQSGVEGYQQALASMIDRARGFASVRQVVVISPPAAPTVTADEREPSGSNAVLRAYSVAAEQVAAERSVGFVDGFSALYLAYVAEAREGGDPPLAIGSGLPGEAGHVVLASSVLRGLGVKAEQLDRIAWSPLPPLRMRRVRGALALKTQTPNPAQAEATRAIYESLIRHDELFFRAWRIAGRRPSAQSREELMAAADQAWDQTQALAAGLLGADGRR